MSKSSAVVSFVANPLKNRPTFDQWLRLIAVGRSGECRHRRRAASANAKCDCDSGYFKDGRQQEVSVLATAIIGGRDCAGQPSIQKMLSI